MRTPFRKSHGKITFVLYTKPTPCTGACLFCFSVKGFTKSTTQNEDTFLAQRNKWVGKLQLSERFNNYNLKKNTGLKCDFAIKGDSFGFHDFDYLRNYFKELYDFLNNSISDNLFESQERQMSAKDKCVTVKIETRPDIISDNTCRLFVELGITTVELGVQSLDEKILKYNRRNHSVQTIIDASELLRRYGFEVCYQIMVGLPGSTIKDDENLLSERLWEEPFCPDAIKIYPCILLKENIAKQKMLRREYNLGRWKPIDYESYVELLKRCYNNIPSYVHVNRIQRIVEEEKIESGVKKEINREIFSQISSCIWQRSIAQQVGDLERSFLNYKIVYCKQGQNRYFFEAVYKKNVVLGYARFDILDGRIGIIRDIRVLGDMLPVGYKNQEKKGSQHIGIGKSLIENIESKAVSENLEFIVVKPSFGSKYWFLQRGFIEINPYYLVKSTSHDKFEHKEKNL